MTTSENRAVTLTFKNGIKLETVPGQTLRDILIITNALPQSVFLAKVNNRVCNLWQTVNEDSEIEWLHNDTPEVKRANQQTICSLLIHALYDITPEAFLIIQHSLGDGLYCETKNIQVTQELLKFLENRITERVREDLSVKPVCMPFEQAIKILKKNDPDFCYEQSILPHHRITLYQYDQLTCHLGYPLLASAAKVSGFKLKLWPPGFVLYITPFVSRDYDPHPLKPRKIFQVFQEYREWENILGIRQGDDINLAIENGEIHDMIKITEGLHEKKIAEIADQINREHEYLRLIFIAGPSSSGKTTFTKRLNIQLRVNGLNPLLISLDDYFIDKVKTPLKINGKPDFESLKAINLKRFNADLKQLMAGESVRLPHYDFISGKSIEREAITLPQNQPILIEGLHGLNELLSEMIPMKNKMKIFVSALTQMNISSHLRIPTSDIRLMRRLIRDYQFRNYSAEHTIEMWPDVREGEEKNIFPFQEEADIIFNSALVYEISVLLHLTRPLLEKISPRHRVYPDARRLLDLYFCFLPLNPDAVPRNSILREFIGGSSFDY